MENWGILLGNILIAILIPIATALGIFLGKLIKGAIAKIENETLQAVAWTAITFVDQKFKDLHGKDKFDKAYEAIAKKLPGVNKEAVEQAIESAVNSMNLSKKSLSSSTNP